MADNNRIRVQVSIEARATWGGTVEMTRAEYDAWCDRIDNARGYEREQVAEELMDLARIDYSRDLNVDDMSVDDFVEIVPAKQVSA